MNRVTINTLQKNRGKITQNLKCNHIWFLIKCLFAIIFFSVKKVNTIHLEIKKHTSTPSPLSEKVHVSWPKQSTHKLDGLGEKHLTMSFKEIFISFSIAVGVGFWFAVAMAIAAIKQRSDERGKKCKWRSQAKPTIKTVTTKSIFCCLFLKMRASSTAF